MSFMRRIWPVYRPTRLHCQAAEAVNSERSTLGLFWRPLDFLVVNAAVLNWQQQDNVCGAVVVARMTIVPNIKSEHCHNNCCVLYCVAQCTME